MADQSQDRQLSDADLEDLVASTDTGARQPDSKFVMQLLLWTAFGWSAFQIWYASPLPFITGLLVINDAQARSLHLGFAMFLAFLAYPALKRSPRNRVPWVDWVLALVGTFCATYRFWFIDELSTRPGLPIVLDIVVSAAGLLLLLEATRRSLGPPLMVVAIVFLLYVFFGNASFLPDVIRYQGASLNRAMDQFWLSDQGVFGIALGVSTRFVFLFVLFGALLDRAGAGNYFIKLAFAMLGHLRGGPAKAAVVASGMTGLISGSSIANVVTTGTFTVPLMKRVGFTPEKAGAVEVASSVNGQIMPPVMGAAAFLMVEYVGIPYTEVIQHAFLPAIISYIALVYIVHLEALKTGMKALPKPGEPLPAKWALIAFGITLATVIIVAGVIAGGFELAGLLADPVFGLIAVVLIGIVEWIIFSAFARSLPKDRFKRTVSVGGLVLMNVILGAMAVFFGMSVLTTLFGDFAAAWIGAVILLAIYVALVAYAARYPELEMDDPNAPVVSLPEVGPTVKTGLYYFLPIIVLVWNLMIERLSPGLSAFWAVVFMVIILLTQRPLMALFRGQATGGAGFFAFIGEAVINLIALVINNIIMLIIVAAIIAAGVLLISAGDTWPAELIVAIEIVVCVAAFVVFLMRDRFRRKAVGYRNSQTALHAAGKRGFSELFEAMVAGARNMIGIGIATATAGIIVGTVSLTGIGLVMSAFVEFLSGGSLILMLVLVAILSLILGMGLPTTANYIVVSALMAPVIVELGAASGLVVPLIAVHLFVFYFGIMADVTPPVGLASFAAAAVSGGDPIKTGFTAFFYSLRTVALPFIFIFNTQLILYDIQGPVSLVLTVVSAVIAMLVFAAATQGYFLSKSRIWESLVLLLVAFTLFRPGYWMDMMFPPTEIVPGNEIFEVVDNVPPDGSLQIRVSGEDIVSGDPVDRTAVITLPEAPTAQERLELIGTTVALTDGRAVLQNVTFGSPAFEAGLDLDYQIDEIVVAADVPPKELIWIPALILLAGIILLQRGRNRRAAGQPATA
ncbi:MAG: TRAP transporter permease [Pseudomonadota bacterium]